LLVAELRVDTASQLVMKRSLTKIEIIRKKQEIDRIFKHGRKYSSSEMRLIAISNNLGFDRLIVIPAKHFGRAVDRNKVRRRAKEVFRLYENRHQADSAFSSESKDYVLVVYPGKVSDFSLLESRFTELLDRANQK